MKPGDYVRCRKTYISVFDKVPLFTNGRLSNI